MADETIQFSIKNENDEEMKKILLEVYNALNEKNQAEHSYDERRNGYCYRTSYGDCHG